MKSIELTEEHKFKLLEMCKNLFPEQKFFWEYEMYGQGLGQEFNDVLCVYFKDKNAYKKQLFPFNIHWFEFCMTYLITKLYNISHLKDESSIKQLRGYVCQDVDHPIDYLYEEFKKLK